MVLQRSHPTQASLSAPQSEPSPLSSPPSLDYDLAIVGGGITGLTLANALKETGLRIALIEANPLEVSLQRRRAYAITLMSGRIFEGLGVWQQILPQVTTFRQIRLSEAHYPTVVQLQPEDLGTEALGYVAEHPVLLQTLYDALQGAERVTWLCPAKVVRADYQPENVVLTIAHADRQEEIRVGLLVAADGARSPLRQSAGIGTHGWQYWQSCVTAVIKPEKSHGDIAREHFWSTGPFATLPLPGNRCQIVLTAPHAEAKAFLDMPESEFLAALEHRYAGQLGKIALEGDRFLFPVQLMQSDRYAQHRLALIGDAAHCCHPVGGQGLNLGIRDAAALAQVIQMAHRRGEDFGALTVLKRYGRWRRAENWMILGFTDFLDRTFSNRWLPLLVVRQVGLWLMRSLRPIRFLALRLMTGLSGRLPALALRSQ